MRVQECFAKFLSYRSWVKSVSINRIRSYYNITQYNKTVLEFIPSVEWQGRGKLYHLFFVFHLHINIVPYCTTRHVCKWQIIVCSCSLALQIFMTKMKMLAIVMMIRRWSRWTEILEGNTSTLFFCTPFLSSLFTKEKKHIPCNSTIYMHATLDFWFIIRDYEFF